MNKIGNFEHGFSGEDIESKKDGIVCPRCGKSIPEEDIQQEWICPLCSTIQHKKCRHLSDSIEVRNILDENKRLRATVEDLRTRYQNLTGQ